MRLLCRFSFDAAAHRFSIKIKIMKTSPALESSLPVAAALFGERVALLPSVTEMFELELARLEFARLAPREIIERGAYFMR